MNGSERTQRAETKLAGFSKLQLTGYQHGMHVFQVDFPSVWDKVSLKFIGGCDRAGPITG